jgi:hypothetical protein
MIRITTCFLVLLAAACNTDSSTMADAAVDGPPAGTFGAECTTVSDTSTECMSGVCTNSFDQIPHPVCSKKCTTLGGIDPTCPNGSQGMKCNMMGYCKP